MKKTNKQIREENEKLVQVLFIEVIWSNFTRLKTKEQNKVLDKLIEMGNKLFY